MSSQIIATVDTSGYKLSTEIDYLDSVTKLPEEYDEFGQGYWKNLSVYNASGNSAEANSGMPSIAMQRRMQKPALI